MSKISAEEEEQGEAPYNENRRLNTQLAEKTPPNIISPQAKNTESGGKVDLNERETVLSMIMAEKARIYEDLKKKKQ